MRSAFPVLSVVLATLLLTSCDFFSDSDNRPPRIALGQLFVADISDAFEVRMLVTAVDADGNLEGVGCIGDLPYQGPSPVEITVAFPLERTGEQIGALCVATDTEGLESSPLDLILTLPDSTVVEAHSDL